MSVEVGIIGGSGLYDMAELVDRDEKTISTPFGDPSGPYVIATLRGRRVAFLARHGHGHRLLPSELNFRANIYGFKVLGVEWILSASAVGSLRDDYKPLDLVIPTQFLDRTRGRLAKHLCRALMPRRLGQLLSEHRRIGIKQVELAPPADRPDQSARGQDRLLHRLLAFAVDNDTWADPRVTLDDDVEQRRLAGARRAEYRAVVPELALRERYLSES